MDVSDADTQLHGEAIAAGTIVAVHDLVSRPQLNGLLGRVLGLDPPTGRYMVAVDGDQIRLKPSNVRRAAHLLNLDGEMQGAIFEYLQTFRDRLNFRAVCCDLRRIANEPLRWRRIMLADQRLTKFATHGELQGVLPGDEMLSAAAFPKARVEALAVRVHLKHNHAASLSTSFGPFRAALPSLDALLRFPRLVELDLSSSILSLSMLAAAFESCAASLRRLNISGVRCPYNHPGSGANGYPESTDEESILNPIWDGSTETGFRFDLVARQRSDRRACAGWRTKSIGWFDELPAAFKPLSELRVLHARGVCRPAALPSGRASQLLKAVQTHCQLLEELVLGWESEFRYERKATPEHELIFNRSPCLALAHVTAGLSRVRVLTLAGYMRLSDSALRGLCDNSPPLVTLDLCGCRSLTEEGLCDALPLIARTLESLNVRCTPFGDQAALALAAGGADMVRLNAGCTQLTDRGLAAISEASTRLRVLDLCYCPAVTTVEDPHLLFAAFTKHGDSLRMLGLGGFERLNGDMLIRILSKMCTKIEHLGIGGCIGLPIGAAGGTTFRAEEMANAIIVDMPRLCPNLTALNAHRLPGVVDRSSLALLVERLPALTSLDVHGTTLDGVLKGTGPNLIPSSKWQELGMRNPGEFFDDGLAAPFISPKGCVHG